MRNRYLTFAACGALWAASGLARSTFGHGFAGDRFFPPTIATDDPFAVDELSLPTVSYVKNAAGDGSPSSHEIDASFEFDKEIFPGFAVGISDNYTYNKPNGQPSVHGWNDIDLTAKQQLWINAPHEAIFSVGLEADIGRTGDRDFSDSFTTLTPTFYFGKGFGDLPDTLAPLRPFAVTGVVGEDFPLSTAASNALEWGFAVEYSLLYLQQNVADIGLPHPIRDMIPLVEFANTSPQNRGGGVTTGTVNPGVLYENPYFELGVEANIPLNAHSGAHVGLTLQVWIFIDDLYPRTFGHPLFGEQQP